MLQKFFVLLNRDLVEVDQRAQSGLSKLKKRKELQIGDHRVKVDSKIAEGGYADIFKVSDAQRNGPFSLINTQSQAFALKRMFIAGRGGSLGNGVESKGHDALLDFGDASQGAALDLASTQATDAVRRAFDCEVQALSKLPNCENLVQMIDHQETEKLDGTEVFILLEYCPNGTLFDLIEQKCKLGFDGISDEAELYKILQDITNGLRCLHDRSISHRDLKIENILQGEDQKWKLCDFGSCTTQQYNTQLSMNDREAVRDEIEKVTTPIYRAPEQLDLFKGYKINTKVDIWALGCIMFTLMYHKPPFEDGQKLAQINGKFRLQDSPAYSDDCISLLKAMLRANPDDRPTAQQIYDRTLKLCGNTKDIVPRIEFKFAQAVQPNQFQSLLKPQSVDKDTRLENFGDNIQFQYSLREPESAEVVKPATQVAQGAPATSKVGATDDAMKIRKAIDFLVEDPSENCWQVKIQRGLINLISQDPAPQACEAAAQKLNSVTQPLEITTCALKFLAVSQNLILYCPDICAGNDLPIFKKLYEKWTDVLEKQASNTADQFRCKFFVKLVAHLSSYISNKLQISKEFDCFIDAGLNLKGIIDNSDFKNNSNRRSPLQIQFLSKLNLLWKHLAVLNSKMLEKPLYLKDIRLQLAITLMEEQYQLMCTLAHLFLAFQVTIQLFNTNISETMLAQVNKFIMDFKLSFHENLESFSQFMISLKQHEELQHLSKKFPPDIPLDLCFVIEDLKDKYIQHHNAKYRNSSLGASDFKLNVLLNIDVSVNGLKIPIPFKTYAAFHQNCHAHFDFVLCQRPFRDKLGQQYQAQRLKEVPHVQKQEGNEGGGEMFRSRYRSISQQEFSSTILESRRRSGVRKEDFQSIGGESAMKPIQNVQAGMLKSKSANANAQRESLISLDGAEQDFLNQSNEVMSYLKTAEKGFIGLDQQSMAKQGANQPMGQQASVQSQLEQVFLQEQIKQGQGSAQSQGQGQSKTAAMNMPFGNKEHGAPANQVAAGPPHPQAAPASEKQLDPASQNKSQFKSLKLEAHIQPSNDDFLMQWNQEYDMESFKSSKTFNDRDDDLGEDTSRSSNAFRTSMEPTTIKPTGGNAFVTSLPKDKKGNVQLQESQYDSKASDYFLLLNLKNKSIVQKRNKIKVKSSEDFLEYEQIYAYMKASRGEKELDLMQTLQDKEMLRQTLLLEKSKQQESEKKVAEHSEELKRLKTQYDKEKENMAEIQQSYHKRSQQLKNEYEERFAEEKMKFADEKKQMQAQIEHQQQKLAEIHQKLKQKKFQEEKEQDAMKSAAQLTQKIAEMQKQLDEANKKMQEQAASEQKGNNVNNKPSEKQGFQPDLENKERNLACQFLDYTLTGREFLKIDLRELTNLKKIGEGAAAVVYQAQYKFTDVAVKKLKVQSLIVNGKLSVEFQREIEALTHISHPNLVLFMGATADEGHPVIVTEFCHGGTLFEVLHEKKTSIPHITFKQRHKMALDIAKGMHFMHSLKPPLMHRDLKSLNLLLSEKVEGPTDFVNVKVTDFGLTRHLSEEENFRMTGQAGTFHWMAPEVLENDSYSEKADVYSYGIVLWEILAREPPFASYTPFQIISKVVQDHERPPLSKIAEDCPRELIVIMRACWEQNPQRRPRFSDVIQGLNLVKPTN